MKKKASQEALTDEEIMAIAESVLVNAAEAQKKAKDPFEAYAYNVQLKALSPQEALVERCRKGYHALFRKAPE